MPAIKSPTDEEELDELPPIDGDGGEPSENDSSEAEELDEDPDDEGADPLDDSTSEGDPLEEIEVSGSEEGWLDDAGDAEALDVGTPDTFGAEEESATLLEGGEETDVGEDDLPLGDAEGASLVGDAGEEGFEDDEEGLHEEDLPRLDADDDDAEHDDGDLLEGLPDEDVSEEARPRWDDRAWERGDGEPAGIAPVDVLASGPEGIFVGGEGLARIDRVGGAVTALEALGLHGGALRALAVGSSEGATLLCVATSRAGLLASNDAGRSFREVNGWRPLVSPGEADGPLQVVLLGQDLWGLGSRGTLVFSGDGGATWSCPGAGTRFEAITGDAASGELIAVARTDTSATAVARGAAGRLVVSGAGPLPPGKLTGLAADSGHVTAALARGVFRLVHEVWSRIDATSGVTAVTFVGREGTLAIALHAEGEGRAWILEARPGAPPLTVAEVGEPGGGGAEANDDGDSSRVRALCWDGIAGTVWAAGSFGLVALRPSRH